MTQIHASPAAGHEMLPACRILFRDAAERSRDLLLADADATGLFVARDGDRLRAAALVQALPGALGVAWPTRGDSREAEDAATSAACAWLRAKGVMVCQAFAPASEAADVAPLERAGFRHTTQLVMLRREPPRVRSRVALDPRLTFSFRPRPTRGDLEATLLATHESSLDCPELNASRTPRAVAEGFTASPDSEWYLASKGDYPVGLAILEPGGDGTLELAYLGVVPAQRGQGFGEQLIRFVCATVAYSVPLNLSVDARNAPAMRLYARHRFAEYDRREVWLAHLNEPRPQGSG